jgi:DNA-binding transcriptional ArsR family regulator
MDKKKIPEVRYRASRICRALGNPTLYETLYLLHKEKRTPEELANILGVNLATVSQMLRVLRDLDLVRYEVKWRTRDYWIKVDRIGSIMQSLERLVKKIDRMR